jgi:hypothetical protein
MELNVHGISKMIGGMDSIQAHKFVKQFNAYQIRTLIDTIDSESLRVAISNHYHDISDAKLYYKVKDLTSYPEFIHLLAHKVKDLTIFQQTFLVLQLGSELRDALITAYDRDFSQTIKKILKKDNNLLPPEGFNYSISRPHIGNFPLNCYDCTNCTNDITNPCGSYPGSNNSRNCDVCSNCNCQLFSVRHGCVICEDCIADFGSSTSHCHTCTCSISSGFQEQTSISLLSLFGTVLIFIIAFSGL